MSETELSETQLRVLREKCQGIDAFAICLVVLLTGLFTAVYFLIFRAVVMLFSATILVGTFVLTPKYIVCLYFALQAALVSSIVPGNWLMNTYLKSHPNRDDYMILDRSRRRWSHDRCVLIIRIIGILASAAFVLTLHWYTCFQDDRIIASNCWSIGIKDHRYTQISRIGFSNTYQAPTGKYVLSKMFNIVFDDGSYWSNESGCGMELKDNPELFTRLAEFLSLKTGKPIEHVNEFESLVVPTEAVERQRPEKESVKPATPPS